MDPEGLPLSWFLLPGALYVVIVLGLAKLGALPTGWVQQAEVGGVVLMTPGMAYLWQFYERRRRK